MSAQFPSTNYTDPCHTHHYPQREHCQCACSCQGAKVHQIVINNDQDLVKGALWGFAAFKLGSATLGALTLTAITSPLFLTIVGAPVPIRFALITGALATMTSNCADNCLYHLGPSRIKVIQVS